MQPFIGPPIPIHLLATTSGSIRTAVVVLIAVSLAVHVVFLVWVFWFLYQNKKYLDERHRILDKQERRWKKERDQRQRYFDEQEQESEQRHVWNHGNSTSKNQRILASCRSTTPLLNHIDTVNLARTLRFGRNSGTNFK